jgi:heat-inducible transcriptional repressor
MTRISESTDVRRSEASRSERGEDRLSRRQETILRAIVEVHVATAAPVGSDTIARRYCPLVSPATVRNEMVALARRGYIRNPHTSSGRIPTNPGYRYYVRHLMGPVEVLPDERRTIDHQFHQIERELDQWLQFAATALARLTENATLVTLPVTRGTRLRHLDLIATQDRAALLIALLQGGTLHQRLVVQAEPLAQEQLDSAAARLTQELRGRLAPEVASWTNARTALDLDVRDSLAHLMQQVDRGATTLAWCDGVRFLLAQPEFAGPEKAGAILQVFEQRRALVEIADAVAAGNGVQVLIGEEIPVSALRDCAVVATRYGSGSAAGVIAVIGPTRLRYDRVVATIEYLGQVMSGLWSELTE